VDAKLVKAFGHPDPQLGLRNAKSLAAQMDKNYPSAAASLREGLEEMFTVARLGIDGRLARTLTTSNPIESMISIARTTNRNVTRWRNGQMVLRWTAAGMLNAERSFRRIKGYKQMPQLVDALRRHAHPDTVAESVGAPHRVHRGSSPKIHADRDMLRLHHSISILGSGPILLASHLRCITRNIEIRIGELSSDTLLVKSWLHWLPRED
jgi:hypothetical protein